MIDRHRFPPSSIRYPPEWDEEVELAAKADGQPSAHAWKVNAINKELQRWRRRQKK